MLVAWLGIAKGKFYSWRERYGRVNEHNASVPRDHWIEDWERDEIIRFHGLYPLEGYRRLTFMMLDKTDVAVSPSTTYRVLRAANLLDRWNRTPSKKGTGFVQPLTLHEHWHIDIAYLNVGGTFYYLCSILDGYSRAVVHWEIRESMTEADIEVILQRTHEKFPSARPRIISDNGPQFIARDLKAFIRELGMTHVRTAPYYPQSNGKIERWHKTLKTTTIRPKAPASFEEAVRVVAEFVDFYNNVRLHSAIGYVTPADKLAGREVAIFAERDRKLEAARARREEHRRAVRDEEARAA
jgi:transposase InsO family protein